MIYWMMVLMAPLFQLLGNELQHVTCQEKGNIFNWERVDVAPFDELILSWNGNRPEEGHYLIQVSVLVDEWSPWINYAYWGVDGQHTFSEEKQDVRGFQDAIEVINGKKGSGFKVRVLGEAGATLQGLYSLHVFLNESVPFKLSGEVREGVMVDLDVPGLSQVALNDPKSLRICSPVSTTSAINYLKKTNVDPLQFANSVWDSAFDIYGNWVLNTAQASHELGPMWKCYVTKLNSFNQIIDLLVQGNPVVVSVRGPLVGSAMPYSAGHLVAIRGYDSEKKVVLCMDPAFSENAQTKVSYPLEDFLKAWARRHGVAYVFERS